MHQSTRVAQLDERMASGHGKRGTATSTFGVGSRESHNSSGFYARFAPPSISTASEIEVCTAADQVIKSDSRTITDFVERNSVALVVTSPPYFAGKQYELELGENGIPASYLEYLEMLTDVFRECREVLEPGGRIAVNVANLGRKPYRSLASDVIGILQDDLGFLLRGEIIWVKAQGAAGNCAWGSFASAANPVLRDLSERVIVASKGRFDRAPSRKKREQLGLPFEDTITREEFLESTLDIWHLRPESARRVGHPAPFPVELPERLITLYTYRGDVVLDPFAGSGTTGVAAVRTQRRFVLFDNDPEYVDLAEQRIETERRRAESDT